MDQDGGANTTLYISDESSTIGMRERLLSRKSSTQPADNVSLATIFKTFFQVYCRPLPRSYFWDSVNVLISRAALKP